MNTILIIITLVVLALLFILMNSAKNKKKKKINEFLAMGKEHGLTFSQYEIGNWFSIGLDEKSPGILVVNQQKPNEFQMIDLIFYFKDKSTAPLSINFYNIDESFQISDELQLAKRWEKIINSVL
ncbi:MAG: hypothetical protein PHS48_05070 [Bacteroidales bacterium]|nr:hypothetical protein [Bacteroidales bacterium]